MTHMNSKRTQERMQRLGQAIRDARERAELSQTALAERCDLTHAAISKIETGKANPTMRKLFRVLEALDIQKLTI
jgi:transcriptional regulator with XRE-family HTH domain